MMNYYVYSDLCSISILVKLNYFVYANSNIILLLLIQKHSKIGKRPKVLLLSQLLIIIFK